MLHIKSNSEPVVGVDTRSGTARALGSLEFISGSCPYEVDAQYGNNLRFRDQWSQLTASHRGSQVNRDNVIDNSRSLTVMSFNGINDDIFLDINTQHNMEYYGFANLRLNRNNEQHLRETDAFSIRIEHLINSTIIAPGENMNRPATIRIPSKSVAGETEINYEFNPRAFSRSGWDYIQFYNQKDEQIDRQLIDANNGPNTTSWIDFTNSAPEKDGVKYYIRDVIIKKVGTTNELRKAEIYFTTSGYWKITFPNDVALAYKNLATGKNMRLRFVFSVSPMARLGATTPIPTTFLNDRRVARPSVLKSSVFTPDGTRGTFIFNRQAYVSAYINNVQVTDRVITTPEGEITVNFNRNVNEGSKIELRLSTVTPVDENILFKVDVADTVAPPPVVASLFTSTRIFGAGGNTGDTAVALRDDIEIGRATIGASLEYLITVKPGITLTTGELVEVYAMDTAGNKSTSELYEIDVAQTTDGVFNPNLGNDAISTSTSIR